MGASPQLTHLISEEGHAISPWLTHFHTSHPDVQIFSNVAIIYNNTLLPKMAFDREEISCATMLTEDISSRYLRHSFLVYACTEPVNQFSIYSEKKYSIIFEG